MTPRSSSRHHTWKFTTKRYLKFLKKNRLYNIFKVIDLLNPGAKRSNLTVRWNKRSRAFVVDNLFSIECGELDDLVAVLEVIINILSGEKLKTIPGQEGLKNRAIGTHNMNDHSSRSHTILTVHIHSEEKASSEDNNVSCAHVVRELL